MPTCTITMVNNRFLPVAAVSLPAPAASVSLRYRALVDTGATRTMISKKVVQQVGLPEVDIGKYLDVNENEEETGVYRLRMDIPIDLSSGPDLRGTDLDALLMKASPSDYDIIWGMDFLSLFHITMVHGKLYLSRRLRGVHGARVPVRRPALLVAGAPSRYGPPVRILRVAPQGHVVVCQGRLNVARLWPVEHCAV